MGQGTSPDKLTYEQIRGVAESFLKKHHPQLTLPIPIEEIVEIQLRVKINTVIGLRAELDVDGFINSNFDEITIDDNTFNTHEERTRFTIAHELGHAILHSKIYKQHDILTKEDYRKFQNKISEEDQKWLEIQAHIFAGCVLVPTKKLKEEITAVTGQDPSKESFQLDYSTPYLEEIPQRFKVSQIVIVKRMQKEGLLKDISQF